MEKWKKTVKFRDLLEDFDDDEQYAQDERFINNLSSTIDEIKKIWRYRILC